MTVGEYLKSKSNLLVGTALQHLQNLQTAMGFVTVTTMVVELNDNPYEVLLVNDVLSIEEPEDSIQTQNNNYEVGYGDNTIQG